VHRLRCQELTIQIIRRNKQLQAQLRRDIHIWHVLGLGVFLVVIEVFADFFEDDAAVGIKSVTILLIAFEGWMHRRGGGKRTLYDHKQSDSRTLLGNRLYTEFALAQSFFSPLLPLTLLQNDGCERTLQIQTPSNGARDLGGGAQDLEFEAVA
jgi:hypothetical protein